MVLSELEKKVEEKKRSSWRGKTEEWKRSMLLECKKGFFRRVIEKIYELTHGDNPIVVTDVGQHQMWAAQIYAKCPPMGKLGGLGTMGYGLPASIGAQVGNPDRSVVLISGDGSIFMKIQELVTAVNYCLPIKIFVINNSYLGMVRQWQGCLYGGRYSCTKLQNPDLVSLVRLEERA